MAVLSQLPLTDENKKEQIDLVSAMRVPVGRTGWAEVDYLHMLQKAETLAEELGDDKRKIRVRVGLGLYYIFKGGDPQLGWKYVESCAENLEMIEDVEFVVPFGANLCVSCLASGDWQRIKRIAPTIISLIEGSGTQAEFFGYTFNPYSLVHALWGMSTGFCGDFDQGERLVEKALSFALEIDHVSTIGQVEGAYGCTLACKGDGQSAAEHLQNAIKCMEESQTIVFLGVTWAWLGWAHSLMGQSKTAVDLTEKGLKMHIELGMPVQRSVCHWFCSYAYFEQGDMEQAQTHAELALQFSLENNEKAWQALSRVLLGRVLAKTNPTQIEAAEQHILQGINLLEELGLVLSVYGYL
jgi:tetratricopeptide (TPR) repeat protein